MNQKHEVYECEICKAHYLTFEGVSSHLSTIHEVTGAWEKVPFGATEFDTTPLAEALSKVDPFGLKEGSA